MSADVRASITSLKANVCAANGLPCLAKLRGTSESTFKLHCLFQHGLPLVSNPRRDLLRVEREGAEGREVHEAVANRQRTGEGRRGGSLFEQGPCAGELLVGDDPHAVQVVAGVVVAVAPEVWTHVAFGVGRGSGRV